MNKLKIRTKSFTARVFNFIMTLEPGRSGVCRGKSGGDFLNEFKIVDEEADESIFWLEFGKDLEITCNKTELHSLIKKANKLVTIFSAAIRTIKSGNPNSLILNPK